MLIIRIISSCGAENVLYLIFPIEAGLEPDTLENLLCLSQNISPSPMQIGNLPMFRQKPNNEKELMRPIPANKKELIRIDVSMTKDDFKRHEIGYFETKEEADYYILAYRNKHHAHSPTFSKKTVQSIEIDGELKEIYYHDFKIQESNDKVAVWNLLKSGDLTNYFAEAYVIGCPAESFQHTKHGPMYFLAKTAYQISTSKEFELNLRSSWTYNWRSEKLLDENPMLLEVTPTVTSQVSFSKEPITICKKYAAMVEHDKLKSAKEQLEADRAALIDALEKNINDTDSINLRLEINEEPQSPRLKR